MAIFKLMVRSRGKFRILGVVGALLVPAAAQADFFIHHWEDHYQPPQLMNVDLDFGYYNSSSNYDPHNSSVTPSGLTSYRRLYGDATAMFGINERFTLWGRVSWTGVHSEYNGLTGDSYGFADQSLGAVFRLYGPRDRSLMVDLQAQVDIPTYSNNNSTAHNLPYIGDGSTDLTAGPFATLPAFHYESYEMDLNAGVGFTYRSDGFSSAVPWMVGARYVPENNGLGLSANFGVYGLQSLKTDNTANSLTGQRGSAGSTSGTGGSLYVNAANSSLMTLKGGATYAINAATFAFSVAQDFYGQNAPKGLTLVGGVTFALNKQMQKNPELKKAEKGFVGYSMEAHIKKAGGAPNQLRIDKGSQDNVATGQVFDIFELKGSDGSEKPVAKAKVTGVSSDEAALTVIEYYKEVLIEEGFTARRAVR